MVKFRPLKNSDLVRIDEIYRKHHQDNFGIPSLDYTLISGVAVDEKDEIIGFGMVKLWPEAIMVLDLDRSLREKSDAMHELMVVAINTVVDSPYDSLHAFVQDNGFSQLLKKHYGFKTCTGEAIYLEVK